MDGYFYYQLTGGEEAWKAVPSTHRDTVATEHRPVFFTVLSVSKLVEDLSYEDKMKLTYEGPLYFDWDSSDINLVIDKVNQFLDKLVQLKVDLEMCSLYATGGKGFHLEIPQAVFIDKLPKAGTLHLPAVYKEIALELCVDTLDLRVYSQGRGRMWRSPNVQRTNGKYKVPVSVAEVREMTPELYDKLTSFPRDPIARKSPALCLDLAIIYARAQQKIEDLMKKKAKFKPDERAAEKARGPSIQWMMAGLGIRPGTGFQELSTQLAIVASTAGLDENAFIQECAGLIANHAGDGVRYNTMAKREEELRRMWRYMDGNPCYEFSVGAIKKLLTHSAVDLDGIVATKEEIQEGIVEAEQEASEHQDEYADVARGVTLTKWGIYADTEFGKKRICAVSFGSSSILMSAKTEQIVGYETIVLVNNKPQGQLTLELEVFASLVQFNRFTAKYGHAFQGTDAQVRLVMMRFVEQAKKKGQMRYIAEREGLDLINLPNHEIPDLREPFAIWADGRGVFTEPRVAKFGLEMVFAGHPDPRGVFKTDIADAPKLAEWIKEPGNKAALLESMQNLMTCQKPELLGKLIGWYVACFWKPFFQRAYNKFPLLHVNGSAGAGKCLGKDTPVLMADGSTKLVQDVVVGDQLLGPDGKPRNVLALGSGTSELYKVHQAEGEDYVVNDQHILSLRHSRGRIVNISIQDYLLKGLIWQQYHKGWRVLEPFHDAVISSHKIYVEPIGTGEYFGFQIDGDHLFLLGDFTVTHNTEMNLALGSLFYYNQEPKTLTPASTQFSIQQHMTASSSIPLILDEYKPHEMNRELHNKLKSMFRDAYNQRDVARGGGTRESEDYRSLQFSQLAAPLCFIAEAAEDESAVMERVVLATVVRPPTSVGLKWLARFQAFRRNEKHLGIIGQYFAGMIVHDVTIDSLRDEFDALYKIAQEKYMMTEADLTGNLSEEELKNKQGAKERSVYNHTVAKFGFQQFRKLLNEMLNHDLDDLMGELEDGMYARMSDLQAATTPEHVKVLSMMATITHHVEADRQDAIREHHEYAFVEKHGQRYLEIAVRPAYLRYRQFCRASGINPLYAGYEAFCYSVRDSAAFHKQGTGDALIVPGVYIFDANKLTDLGVEPFKEGTKRN